MKIGLFLTTTFLIDENSDLFKKKFLTNNSKRIQQYINGIKSIQFFKNDIILLDNSSPIDKLPIDLQNTIKEIPNLQYIYNTKNTLGKINKTAGIIDVWKNNIRLFEKYDYIIHFEPRQKIVDNSFFNKEGNNFYVDKTGIQFHTGLFKIESNLLIKFINESNLGRIMNDKLQLESLLFQFIDKKGVKYNIVDKLGLVWYDSYKNDKEILI